MSRRKIFPYYKVQRISPLQLAWIDARKEAFDTLDQAKAFISETLKNEKWRIIVVERGKRDVLEQS